MHARLLALTLAMTMASACGSTTPCAAQTGAGTTHTSLTADETWSEEGSPHLLPTGLTIPEGVTLTIGQCAVVKVGGAHSLSVSGRLVTQGAENRPVTITQLDAQPWYWIDAVRTTARPALDLSYTTVSGGGLVDGYAEFSSMVHVRGDDAGPMIKVNQLTLTGSQSVGLIALDDATFASGSTGLFVHGSALEPALLTIWGADQFPDGDLTGNGDDEVGITTSSRLGRNRQTSTVTLKKLSVPWRVGMFGDADGSLLLGPPVSGLGRLVVEPGATVTFARQAGLETVSDGDDKSLGSLIAQGTEAAPITFTSGEKTRAAGDWLGLFISGVPTDETVLDHVVIEYGGYADTTVSGYSCGAPPAPSPGKIAGGLRFATSHAVTRQLLTHSVVRHSGSNGVDRGWAGDQVDYLATNTFSDIAFCAQTQNRDAQSQCPATPSCPGAP